MKNRKMLSAAFAVVGAVAMCAGAFAQTTTTTTTTTNSNGTVVQSTNTYTTDTNRIGVNDMIFLQDLMHANAEEIALSRVALHQASSVGVSDFAQMMINDHEALQNQLMNTYGSAPWMTGWRDEMRHRSSMINSVGMDYYNNNGAWTYHRHDNDMNNSSDTTGWQNWMILDASDWEKVRALKSLNGYEFDRQYIQMMVRDHDMLLHKIWRENDMTTNSDLKSLTGTVQGTVTNHLEEARRISYNYDDPFGIDRSYPWYH